MAEIPKDRVIGVRVDRATLRAIDLLVDAGVSETRSAAAAWLIRAGIEARRDLFGQLTATAEQIRDLRVRAQSITRDLLKGE